MRNPIWTPSEDRRKRANLTDFMRQASEKYHRQFLSYDELHDWSINYPTEFWAFLWQYLGIKASRQYDSVITTAQHMMHTRWFTGARLNFAENLLRYRDGRTAIIFKGENKETVRMTYAELYDNVARVAESLKQLGVGVKDRVAGFMPNMPETVIAMLATTSIGAMWSSCSPDFGLKGVLDRFRQVEPRVLFTANGYSYNGKPFDSVERVAEITRELPSVEKVVVVPYIERNIPINNIANAVYYPDFLSSKSGPDGIGIAFEQLPSDHPLYIMYTSGTTGLPKCMVQGAAGVLVNQMKELVLHTDLKREDIIFYFTTCGWMMWNWLVCSLSVGATVVLFDGSPFFPDPDVLWRLAEAEKITIFGTSARYLAEIERRGLRPAQQYNLDHLRTVLSTGSPLSPESFEYVYRDVKNDVLLSSISGGTDINGGFFVGNPIGPVYAGELQCRALGMKVEAFDTAGQSVVGVKGELVCTTPVPSMPLYLWNDPGDERYYSAYFDKYPDVWTHGDYVEITETGGAVIYGRSDAVLNAGGVRIGTAEIYGQVEALEEIVDSVAVGQRWENDTRIVLFVKLGEGVSLDDALVTKIKQTIRQNTTPRHVPAKIVAVDDIPYTINMKKVEKAVTNVIHGEPVTNLDALANPESLALYRDLPELTI